MVSKHTIGGGALALMMASAIALSSAAAQESEPAAQQSSVTANDQLLELARSRVAQHEIRVAALGKLGALQRELVKGRIDNARFHVESLQSAVAAAQAEQELRKNELARLKQLAASGTVSSAEVAQSENAMAASNAQVARMQGEVRQAESGLRTTEFELEQVALEAAIRAAEASIALLDAKAEVVRLEQARRRARSFNRQSGDADPTPAAPPRRDDSP
jgi:hypothetical protein